MKKISLWALSATLITVPMLAVFLIVGCSKNDSEQPSAKDLVGTWATQLIGETGEDLLGVTMNFKDDATMTIICELSDSEESGEEESTETRMYWKLDGDKICFAYVDINEDEIPDPEESLDWEPFSFRVSENTLELSCATGINIWKYKKMN